MLEIQVTHNFKHVFSMRLGRSPFLNSGGQIQLCSSAGGLGRRNMIPGFVNWSALEIKESSFFCSSVVCLNSSVVFFFPCVHLFLCRVVEACNADEFSSLYTGFLVGEPTCTLKF